MPASFQGALFMVVALSFTYLGRGKLGIEELVRLEVRVDVRKKGFETAYVALAATEFTT